MKKSKKIISAALCLGLMLTGCGGKKTEEAAASDAVLVDEETAQVNSLVLSNQFVGTISPQESVYIIPLAQGTVTDVFFEIGDEVKEGDVLFKIDDSGARIQLEQAQLSYNNAKLQADSTLTTQQNSAALQLESSIAQADQYYVRAQAEWKNASDAYDSASDAYDKVKKQLKAAESAETPDAELIAKLQESKKELAEKKDQLKLSRNAAEAAYRDMETMLNSARKSKELTQGDVLEDTKKQLNNGLDLAKVGVEAAELSLSYYQVTTPISGKVIAKNVEVNAMATSASPAYTIAAEDSMTVTFQVSEAVMNTLSRDQKIVVERNGNEYEGVITEIANSVGMGTGLFQVKAMVKANGEELPSGVSVKVTSETYKSEADVVIPYGAVYFENEGAYVYLDKDGKAEKTYVTVGIFDDENIQITDGISVGDSVITSWSPRLMNGVEVKANRKQEAAEQK